MRHKLFDNTMTINQNQTPKRVFVGTSKLNHVPQWEKNHTVAAGGCGWGRAHNYRFTKDAHPMVC